MNKILVVDGSNLLFQMFYGMPARILGPNGKPIQGTLGFVGALLKILRMVQPSHAAVLFDGECANPRKELDAEYKANREDWSQVPEEELPFSQLPDIFQALQVLGIAYAETDNCEADDWMAGYAFTYGQENDVVIASQDSDLFQLISPNIRILRYRGDQTALWDETCLMEKYGIFPRQYADHKALTGDASDHIPGVPGIGCKTATALLRQFGSLEEMLFRTEEIRRPSVRRAVEENADRVRLNARLIKLENRQELPFSLEEMVWQDRGITTHQVLQRIGLR